MVTNINDENRVKLKSLQEKVDYLQVHLEEDIDLKGYLTQLLGYIRTESRKGVSFNSWFSGVGQRHLRTLNLYLDERSGLDKISREEL